MQKTEKRNLTTWINTIGPKKIAEKLEVNITTVHHWKRRFALPRPNQMKIIKTWSRGAITYSEMIESFLSHKAKERKKKKALKSKKTFRR